MRRQLQRLAVILRRHQLLAGDGFHQFQSCVVHGSGSFGEVSIFVVRCNVTYAAPVEKRPLPIESNRGIARWRSEEHTSELQSLMRNSYAVFCLKKNTKH